VLPEAVSEMTMAPAPLISRKRAGLVVAALMVRVFPLAMLTGRGAAVKQAPMVSS